MTAVSARNNKDRGKSDERDVARRLGATRHPADSGGLEDCEHPWLAIQVKGGKAVVNDTIRTGLDAARVAALDTKKLGCLAVVDRKGTRLRRFVVFDLDEYAEWNGLSEGASPPEEKP